MSDKPWVLGGVGPGDWGQDVNETLLNSLVGSNPTWDRPLEQVERHLLRMPLDALRVFEPFLPGTRAADFGSSQSAVTAIMGALTRRPDFLEKIREVINNIVNGWQGNSEQWDPFNVFVTMEEIAQAFDMIQTQINEFAVGGTAGVAVSENFSTYPNGGPGGRWTTWHKGLAAETIQIKDGKLWLYCFPLAERYGWAKYNAVEMLTDYQRVSAVFATKPATGGLQGKLTAFNYLMGRVAKLGDTPDSTTHVFAKLGSNQAHIGVNIRGVETLLKSAPVFNFNPAANYTLQLGVKGATPAQDAPRTFRLWEGQSNLILEAFDPTNISFVGSTHRFTGVGFGNENALQSARIASFVAFDSK